MYNVLFVFVQFTTKGAYLCGHSNRALSYLKEVGFYNLFNMIALLIFPHYNILPPVNLDHFLLQTKRTLSVFYLLE